MAATMPPAEIVDALRRMGLVGRGPLTGRPLAGGVSSDIWKILLPDGPVCVKRALDKLRVDADWRAPVERNLYEARWMRSLARPHRAPCRHCSVRIKTRHAGDEYLPPERYHAVEDATARRHRRPGFRRVGGGDPACIHGATAADPSLAEAFPTDGIFFDIRLEPYLRRDRDGRHPDPRRRAAMRWWR